MVAENPKLFLLMSRPSSLAMNFLTASTRLPPLTIPTVFMAEVSSPAAASAAVMGASRHSTRWAVQASKSTRDTVSLKSLSLARHSALTLVWATP